MSRAYGEAIVKEHEVANGLEPQQQHDRAGDLTVLRLDAGLTG